MLTLNSLNLDNHLAIFLAVNFAESSLPIWEAKYPEDKRPRKGIEAARSWLKDPDEEKADAVADAGDAAAYAYAWAAADALAAAYAAKASAYAAYAAQAADAARATKASAYAADHAAGALFIRKENLIHKVISQNLDYILKYKVEKEQSFSKPEIVFEHLNEEGRELFLFNLDILT